MRSHRRLALFVALGAAAPAWTVAQQGPGGDRPAIRVVAVSGSPYERGFQHGEELREEIAALLDAWAGDLRKGVQLERQAFVDRFLGDTQFEAAARRWTPELLDEVRGIAAGAEQSYETMLVWQLVDEMWVYAADLRRDKCTTIGVDRRGDQPAIVAQNIDIPRWYHGHQTVLRIRDEARSLESLVVTIPGLVGAAGLSSARVAVGVNTLMQLRPCRDGLPVAFVVRGLLMQEGHDAALRFLHGVVHASGQNYTVGGPDTAPGFECSAGKVSRYVPYAGAKFTFHTNDPRINDDFASGWLEHAQHLGKSPFEVRTCPRFATCGEHLPQGAEPDVAAIKALLASRERDPSVCNAHTYCCIVMTLGAVPELQITAGGADKNDFEVLRIDRP